MLFATASLLGLCHFLQTIIQPVLAASFVITKDYNGQLLPASKEDESKIQELTQEIQPLSPILPQNDVRAIIKSLYCSFTLEAIGGYTGNIELYGDGSMGISEIADSISAAEFYLESGQLSSSSHARHCYVHPEHLQFMYVPRHRILESVKSPYVNTSTDGLLLQNGRREWIACPSMAVQYRYVLYSDRRSSKQLCRKVQLMVANKTCANPEREHSKKPQRSILNARDEFSVTAASRKASETQECHFRLSIINGTEIWYPSGIYESELHLIGKHLVGYHDGKLLNFFIQTASEEFTATNTMIPYWDQVDFSLSGTGDLLHSGRRNWLLCKASDDKWLIYSDKLIRNKGCHIVQLRASTCGENRNQTRILHATRSTSQLLTTRAKSSLATPFRTPCRSKLSIIGTQDPDVFGHELGGFYSLGGGTMHFFVHLPCYISAPGGLECPDDHKGSWADPKDTRFEVSNMGNLMHNGTEKWIICKPAGEGPFKVLHPSIEGLKIHKYCPAELVREVQIKVSGIDCDAAGSGDNLRSSDLMNTNLQQPPDPGTPFTLYSYGYVAKDANPLVGDFGPVAITKKDMSQVNGEPQTKYVLTGSRLQESSYGRQCLVDAETFQLLCEHRAFNRHGQKEFSIKSYLFSFLIHGGREYWLMCRERDGRSTIWSDEKPNKDNCELVRLRIGIEGGLNTDVFSMAFEPDKEQAEQVPLAARALVKRPSRTFPLETCPTDLANPQFQFPHLIIPVSDEAPSHAFGYSYFPTISKHNSTIFNFDIPASKLYKDSTCALIFLFPEQQHLAQSISNYKVTGLEDQEHHLRLVFYQLDEPATMKTTWADVKTSHPLRSVKLQPGSAYQIGTGRCNSGGKMSFMINSGGNVSLRYFQGGPPDPIGLYIVPCSKSNK